MAPNRYNLNYRLVEKSAPKWPFKGMERNTTPMIIKNIPGPSEYTVNAGDIAYKIHKQLTYNQQHSVSKPPFNSATERYSSTVDQKHNMSSIEEDQKTLDETNECIRPHSTFVSKTGRSKLQVQSSGVDKYYNIAKAVDKIKTKTSHNKRRTPFNQTSRRFAEFKTQRLPGPADYVLKQSTYCATNRLNFGTYSERQPKSIAHGRQTYELPNSCKKTLKVDQLQQQNQI
ncbi:uncharacterized protein LOC126834848 [Adelges cooleyi]|uniref:uncharacterized protein LOC126834848 n=1 Tax=Adelges cooleyi TaxID=133065 RepID=UPI0021802322|nr:uncharacterized protein LOC126834848 [Adelges cooleyi]